MAKLQEGYRVFQYNGKNYGVPEDLSDDEARRQVEDFLGMETEEEPTLPSYFGEAGREGKTRVSAERTVDPETESEGFMQEIAEGTAAGIIKAGQGLGELIALPSDYFFDTDYANKIQEESEALQEYLGLDPVGVPGQLAEVAAQFILPGGLAAKAAVRLSRLGRLDRAARQGRASIGGPTRILSKGERRLLLAQQAGAATVADIMVTSDGTASIGDFVEGGPTLTNKNVGLTGSEEAVRLLENKLKIGAEAGSLFTAFPYAIKGLSIMGKPVADIAGAGLEAVVVPTVTKLRTAAEVAGNSRLAESIGNTQVNDTILKLTKGRPGTTVGDVYQGLMARFRFRGNLAEDAAEVRGGMQGYLDSVATKAGRTMKQLEDAVDKELGTNTRLGRFMRSRSTALERTEILNSVYRFLTEETPEGRQALLNSLPTSQVRRAAQRMRNQIDDLTLDISQSRYFTQELGEDAQAEILANLGSYLRKKYRVFEDPDAYFGNQSRGVRPSQEYIQNRNAASNLLSDSNNYNSTRDLYSKIVRPLGEGEELGIRTDGGVAPQFVNEILDTIANRYRKKVGIGLEDKVSGRVIRDKLKTGLLAPRRVDNEAIRLMLGEIKNPTEAFAATMADMSEFIAKERFYSFMDSTKVVDPSLVQGGRLANDSDVIGGDVYNRLAVEEKAKYVELTEDGTGTLQSRSRKNNLDDNGDPISTGETWVKRGVYNDITRSTWYETAPIINLAYSTFMLGKGFAQKAATVFSPVTQVRNVTSAALFAAANGNWGRGANVGESMSLVLENIRRTAPEKRAEFYQMLQENGIIGTQAQIREIDRIIDDGLAVTRGGEFDQYGVNLAQKKARGKLGQFISSIDKGARDLYQGGDDIWKIYSFDFERSKLINAFRGNEELAERYARQRGFRDLNDYAADIVKNTVPNYDRVPQFVKDLRKLPIGNFVAFPAEIVRTTTNILKRSVDEIQEGRQMMEEGRQIMQRGGDSTMYDTGQNLRDIGRRRLTGLTLTTTTAGPAVQQFGMLMTNTTAEAIDALREIAPPWSQNSTLIPTSVDKDGQITGFIDFSFFNPYDYLRRPVAAILNEVNKGNELDLNAAEISTNAGIQMLSEMLSPFAEEAIFAERIADVTLRQGRTRTGARVWNEGDVDSIGTKMAKSFVHIAESLNPGIVRETFGEIAKVDPRTTKVERSFILGGDLEMNGRIATALGAGVDSRGNVRQVGEEVARLFTGIGEYKVTPQRALMYRGLEYNTEARRPQSLFNRALRTGENSPLKADNVIEAYRNMNERAFVIQNKMHRLIKKMEALGMKKSEIRRELQKQKIADWEAVYSGKFTPVDIPKNITTQVNKAQRSFGGDMVPQNELAKIRQEFESMKLTESLPEGEEPLGYKPKTLLEMRRSILDETSQLETLEQPVAAAVPPPAAAQAGAAPAQMAVPAPTTANLDPSLLGSNPIDAMRNLQIAQRTR
jgi:hypothetical protein